MNISETIRAISEKNSQGTKPRFRIFWNDPMPEDYTGPAIPPIYCVKIFHPLQTVWFESSIHGMWGIKSNGDRITNETAI